MTVLTEAKKRELLDVFGKDIGTRMIAALNKKAKALKEWKGFPVGYKSTGTATLSKAQRDDLLLKLKAYNPSFKDENLDALVKSQGVDAIRWSVESMYARHLEDVKAKGKGTKDAGREKERRAKLLGKIRQNNPKYKESDLDLLIEMFTLDTMEEQARLGFGAAKEATKEASTASPTPAVKVSADGWYKPSEFAAAKQKERDLLDAVQAEVEKQAGVYIHPMFGTKVYPDPPKPVVEVELHPFWKTAVTKEKAVQRVVVNSKWYGKQAFPITRKKAYGDLELSDAIDAMQKALELADEVVLAMINKNGYQGTYDLLKSVIEAQGGKVEFTLQVKR